MFKLITDYTDERLPELPFLYFDCGIEDSFLKINLKLAELLAKKKIPHEYRQAPGGHDWLYWDSRTENIFKTSGKGFRASKSR